MASTTADHFVAGFADGRGVAVVGQVMDMAHIAAAEGQAQGFDDGAARLQCRLGRFDEGALSAGDNLDGFHVLDSPAGFWQTGVEYSSLAGLVMLGLVD